MGIGVVALSKTIITPLAQPCAMLTPMVDLFRQSKFMNVSVSYELFCRKGSFFLHLHLLRLLHLWTCDLQEWHSLNHVCVCEAELLGLEIVPASLKATLKEVADAATSDISDRTNSTLILCYIHENLATTDVS